MAYLDEGLATFREQWKAKHPKAVVYWIADSNHSQNPDVSQHAPDRESSKPGEDKGEVDAVDVMPGNGVTEADLTELFTGLHKSRDPRVLYVIYKRQIFSSVTRPWEIRPHTGDYHAHVHIGVNDNFDRNTAKWSWEPMAAQQWKTADLPTGSKLPTELTFGMEDAGFEGYDHIVRAQALLNLHHRADPLDLDGVYGANTAAKVRKVFGGNGRTITFGNLRKLHGI
jgi:hypothetical protein